MRHLGGMLTPRPIFLDFRVRLGGQDEVQKITFMLKCFSRGPPGGSGRRFGRVFKTHFNIEVSWHRFLKDFGRPNLGPRKTRAPHRSTIPHAKMCHALFAGTHEGRDAFHR